MEVRFIVLILLGHFAGLVKDTVAPFAIPAANVEEGFGAVDGDAVIDAFQAVVVPDAHLPDETFFAVVEGHVHGVGGGLVVVEEVFGTGAADADGEIGLEGPAGLIDLVGAIVAHVAGAEVPTPVPLVVMTVFVEGHHFGGADPGVVIEAGREGAVRFFADVGAVLGVPGLGHEDAAEAGGVGDFDGSDGAGAAAGLHAGLDDAVVFAGGFDKEAALAEVVGDGFFDVDIFASGAGENGGGGVPVVGSGDDDGVDLFIFEDAAEIGAAADLAVAGFIGGRLGLFQARLIDVAEMGEAGGGDAGKLLGHEGVAAAADADDADADRIRRGSGEAAGKGQGAGRAEEEASIIHG